MKKKFNKKFNNHQKIFVPNYIVASQFPIFRADLKAHRAGIRGLRSEYSVERFEEMLAVLATWRLDWVKRGRVGAGDEGVGYKR